MRNHHEHGHEHAHAAAEGKIADPVCGMAVSASSEHDAKAGTRWKIRSRPGLRCRLLSATVAADYDHCGQFADAIADEVDSIGIWA
ncbi:MAG: hypothetical protein D6689_22175 [Deltaproteobacteria bacterium]|nr:MAG: hypothetical protein D6689_22175 [Deltaproteobacteria bacterium]